MEHSKRYLLGLVVTLQANALLADALPYFPIEISRAAASTALNRWLFPFAVAVGLPLIALHWDGLGGNKLRRLVPAWMGLVALAWFDDARHWTLHMLGVALMVGGLLCANWRRTASWHETFWQNERLCGVVLLYALRIALKGAVVALFEVDSVWEWRAIAQRLVDVPMQGGAVCASWLTLPVFRLCGALQWLVFALLADAIV